MKLAVVQIALGVFILASLFWFTVWVEPGFTHIHIPSTGGDGVAKEIFLNPGRNVPLRIWMAVYSVLGLSVLGGGIAQFIKEKRLRR